MGMAMTILRTAAVVGAGLLANPPGRPATQDQAMHIGEALKKNASAIFLLMFLRDVIRSLLVVMFIGMGAMAATWSVGDDALFRAATFFSLALFLLVAILSAVAASRVKRLARDAKDLRQEAHV